MFQSTRPVRGATIVSGRHTTICYRFNPRAPYGARQAGRLDETQGVIVSIHAPRTGRDVSFKLVITRRIGFNPRAPYGARLRTLAF